MRRACSPHSIGRSCWALAAGGDVTATRQGFCHQQQRRWATEPLGCWSPATPLQRRQWLDACGSVVLSPGRTQEPLASWREGCSALLAGCLCLLATALLVGGSSPRISVALAPTGTAAPTGGRGMTDGDGERLFASLSHLVTRASHSSSFLSPPVFPSLIKLKLYLSSPVIQRLWPLSRDQPFTGFH